MGSGLLEVEFSQLSKALYAVLASCDVHSFVFHLFSLWSNSCTHRVEGQLFKIKMEEKTAPPGLIDPSVRQPQWNHLNRFQIYQNKAQTMKVSTHQCAERREKHSSDLQTRLQLLCATNHITLCHSGVVSQSDYLECTN